MYLMKMLLCLVIFAGAVACSGEKLYRGKKLRSRNYNKQKRL